MRLINWLRDLYSVRVPQKYDIVIAMAIVTAAFIAFVIAWQPAARFVQGPPGQPGKDGRSTTHTAQPNAPPGKRTTITPYGSGKPLATPTPQPPASHPPASSEPTRSPAPRTTRVPTKRDTDQPPLDRPTPPRESSSPAEPPTSQPPASSPSGDGPTFTETPPDPTSTG